ncbi:tectonic-1-like, partial [Haplochromis burtoni]|uniref:tectonic-1-like n=1 Tax=Haplochromis burtoni TaxID=8153 RepID=UPI001C2CDDBE
YESLLLLEVVPVVVSSVILQSADRTQTELKVTGGGNISPVLINPTLCGNVVLKVLYVIKYNPQGKIENATVSVVLGFVTEAVLHLEQEFQVTYIQADGGDVNVHYSGNPGYVVGLPLTCNVLMFSKNQDLSITFLSTGIVRSIDLRDALSLLLSTEDQDCLQGPHQRSPVLFGHDSVSGCLLRLEDGVNCTIVSQELLGILRGFNYPYYVASFGNSRLDNLLDWVQIKTNFNPTVSEVKQGAQYLTMITVIALSDESDALNKWTNYGSFVNPQAQIVSIKEVIQSNTSSLTLLSRGSSVLPIRSSVAFIPVSAAALPGYRATPTINAKLPFDFFFPFV